jgi:outer membrane protein
MKKIIATMLVLTAVISVSAQFLPQGTHLLSGSVGFETYKEKYKLNGNTQELETHTAFSLMPSYGYFIMDNLCVGGMLNFSTETEKLDDDKSTLTEITIGPFVRYYVQDIGFYGQGYVGFGTASGKTEGSFESDFKESVFQWRLGIGYSIKITDSVLLDPMLSYGQSTYSDKDSDLKYISSGHIMLQAGFTVFLAR